MRIRIEFPASKALNLPWVLRLCRKMPAFTEKDEDDMRIYSVEFNQDEASAFEAIWVKIRGWKSTAIYLDGKLVSGREVQHQLYLIRAKRNRLRNSLRWGNAGDVIREL